MNSEGCVIYNCVCACARVHIHSKEAEAIKF